MRKFEDYFKIEDDEEDEEYLESYRKKVEFIKNNG